MAAHALIIYRARQRFTLLVRNVRQTRLDREVPLQSLELELKSILFQVPKAAGYRFTQAAVVKPDGD